MTDWIPRGAFVKEALQNSSIFSSSVAHFIFPSLQSKQWLIGEKWLFKSLVLVLKDQHIKRSFSSSQTYNLCNFLLSTVQSQTMSAYKWCLLTYHICSWCEFRDASADFSNKNTFFFFKVTCYSCCTNITEGIWAMALHHHQQNCGIIKGLVSYLYANLLPLWDLKHSLPILQTICHLLLSARRHKASR